MLIAYKSKKFSDEHQGIIDIAADILRDYGRQGYKLSLRQLYYQFVSKALIENTERSYKRLGGIITEARMCGLISWTAIEDRGRTHSPPYVQPDAASVLDGISYHYAEDFWEDQYYYVEVWVEKDALSSVIERPCNKWRVPYMACKGYMSASAQWEAGQRFQHAHDRGKRPVLIHLGDHDPSGLDMTRDNGDRLYTFAGTHVDVRRIALNMDQVDEYAPPPNPAKVTDSRAAEYIMEYGETSWELDALTPSVIDALISDEIKQFIDMDLWDDVKEKQRDQRDVLSKISDNAEAVFDFVRDL